MGRPALIAIIVVAILVVGGAIAMTHKSNNNPAPASSTSTQNTSTNPSASNSNQPAAANAVTIENMMFTPSQITVQKGGTVTWTNKDNTTHTVVDDLSNVGGPHSGDIAPGSTYSFTFDTAGSFQYHCSIHPSMRGTIVVK